MTELVSSPATRWQRLPAVQLHGGRARQQSSYTVAELVSSPATLWQSSQQSMQLLSGRARQLSTYYFTRWQSLPAVQLLSGRALQQSSHSVGNFAWIDRIIVIFPYIKEARCRKECLLCDRKYLISYGVLEGVELYHILWAFVVCIILFSWQCSWTRVFPSHLDSIIISDDKYHKYYYGNIIT